MTASITVPRNAPCSKAFTPQIVEPPGLQTASFSSPGCLPLSMRSEEAPSRDRLTAAKDFLDRAGFSPTEKIEQTVDMELNITVDYGEGSDKK